MHYKTMVLDLLEDRPRLRERLQKERKLLLTVESVADSLKKRHEVWMRQLERSQPPSHPSQIASEALELALAELSDNLPPESTVNEESFSLDDVILFRPLHSSGG
jgi:hypothetical protein